MLKIKCMYTKHLEKKRKTWSDGFLKVNIATRRCQLIDEADYRELGIASRTLEVVEMKKLEHREEFNVMLGAFMVQIESAGYAAGLAAKPVETAKAYQPPLKLAKFVTPSAIAPKAVPPPVNFYSSSSSTSANQYGSNPSVGGNYKVSNDELDDIWGGEGAPRVGHGGGGGGRPPAAAQPIVSNPAPAPRPPREQNTDYESRYRPTPKQQASFAASANKYGDRDPDDFDGGDGGRGFNRGGRGGDGRRVRMSEPPVVEEWPIESAAERSSSTWQGGGGDNVWSDQPSMARAAAPPVSESGHGGVPNYWDDSEAPVEGGGNGVFRPRYEEATPAAVPRAAVDESVWSFD